MSKKKEQAPWRNRIVRNGEQPASQFVANPLNWRIHPKAQRQAINGILGDVGWVQQVVINRTTGHVLDGHARVEEALKIGDETPVPFVEVHLSEEEEQKILLTFDPISSMAATDKMNLETLLQSVSTDSQALSDMLADLAKENDVLQDIEDKYADVEEEEEMPMPKKAFDAIFPSDNEWGIPTLLKQPPIAGLPMPCNRWGRYARGSFNPGSLHFYTDDDKFNAIWDTPEKIVMSQCKAILEPNVSTGEMTPNAVALWGIYRKRWISRWVQQFKITVFVDLNVEPQFHELNLLGVPKGWTHWSTRGSDRRIELLGVDYELAAKHADGNPVVFVVVGGGNETQKRCVSNGWIHVPQEQQVIQGRQKAYGT